MNDLKIKSIGQKQLKISEKKEAMANFYSIIPIIEKKDTVNHHILLVDVSGSMHSHLKILKVKLLETLKALKNSSNNYVSVILYSSHGECYRIINAVKCDDISYKMSKVEETIEKELYSRSITVISEPLQTSIDISESLVGVADKHHIILFTDGCVVPSKWGYKEEEEKCFDLAQVCKEKNIFLDAIGFGNYYDRDFLRKLVEIAGKGTVNHIDQIPEYYNSALEMINKVNDEIIISLDIDSDNFFILTNNQLYYKPTTIKSLNKNEENIIVVFDEELIVNNELQPLSTNDVPLSLIEDFLYGLSLNHVIYNRIDDAEITIAETKDKAAYKLLSNCYSFAEKGKVINNLQDLIINKNNRFKEGKEDIQVYSLEDEPICLLELLEDILEDKNSKLLWDMSYNYNRITQKSKSIEDDIEFIYPKEGYMPIDSITIGSQKLNINVLVTINSQVVNKKNTMKMDACIFRDYALVKNGIKNVEQIAAILSKDLLKKYKEFIIKNTKNSKGEKISIIDLTKIKSTNKRMLKTISSTELIHYLNDIEVLGAKQWAIKQHIKTLSNKTQLSKLELSSSLTDEIIEARKLFRIDEKGVYKPLSVEKEENELFEVYPATIIEWKIEKFPKTQTQKDELVNYEYLLDSDHPKESLENLQIELKKVQEEKNFKTNKVNLVRISSGLMNKPIFLWENVETKSKKVTDKTFNANMVVNEEMTVSTTTIDNINVREDRYVQLIKAN